MRRALVTGGTGFVGAAVVDRLLAEGWHVALLVRDESRVAARHRAHVEVCRGDLAAPLPSLPAAEVIIHAAADMNFDHGLAKMRAVTIGGTVRLLEAARRAEVAPRFVHVSSQAVYGLDVHHHDADEATPLRPSPHAYCEAKRFAEDAVRDAGQAGLPVAIVRPGFIYGPGDQQALPPVVDALRRRQLRAHLGDGGFDTGCLHVENCAEGILLAATHPAAVGEAFNLGDGRVLTIQKLVADLAAALGVPPPAGAVPLGLARAAGHVVAGAWRVLGLPGRAPLSPFLVAMLTRNSGFSIEKARRVLGYVPARQWEESLPETLAWCEQALRRKPA